MISYHEGGYDITEENQGGQQAQWELLSLHGNSDGSIDNSGGNRKHNLRIEPHGNVSATACRTVDCAWRTGTQLVKSASSVVFSL